MFQGHFLFGMTIGVIRYLGHFQLSYQGVETKLIAPLVESRKTFLFKQFFPVIRIQERNFLCFTLFLGHERSMVFVPKSVLKKPLLRVYEVYHTSSLFTFLSRGAQSGFKGAKRLI